MGFLRFLLQFGGSEYQDDPLRFALRFVVPHIFLWFWSSGKSPLPESARSGYTI